MARKSTWDSMSPSSPAVPRREPPRARTRPPLHCGRTEREAPLLEWTLTEIFSFLEEACLALLPIALARMKCWWRSLRSLIWEFPWAIWRSVTGKACSLLLPCRRSYPPLPFCFVNCPLSLSLAVISTRKNLTPVIAPPSCRPPTSEEGSP